MEQHLYPTPLPSIITALSHQSGISEELLSEQYLREVSEHRRVYGELWGLKFTDPEILYDDYGNLHPFIGFRVSLAHTAMQPESAIQFCMAFSIHPFTLSKYENFDTEYPKGVRIALTEAGLPDNINTVLATGERFNRVG
jgi:hypothetical protein